MKTSSLVVTLLAVVGCGTHAAETSAAWLTPIAREVGAVHPPLDIPSIAGLALPTVHASHGAPHDALFTLTLGPGPDAFTSSGRVVDVAGAREDITAAATYWPTLHPGAPAPQAVRLAADARLPLSAVLALRSALGGTTHLELVAAVDAPPPPPPPPALAALATIVPGSDPIREGPLLGAPFHAACPGLYFPGLVGSEARPGIVVGILRDMPHTPGCDCTALDHAAFRYAALRAAGAYDPPRTTVALPAVVADADAARTVQDWVAAQP